MRYNYVKLYVEKYSNGELLLDFIDENEFLYVKQWMNLFQYRLDYFEPSQILIHKAYDLRIKEGEAIYFPIRELFNLNQFF